MLPDLIHVDNTLYHWKIQCYQSNMTCNSIQTIFTDITEFNSVLNGRGESHFDFHTKYVIMIRGGAEGSSLMTFRNSVKYRISKFKNCQFTYFSYVCFNLLMEKDQIYKTNLRTCSYSFLKFLKKRKTCFI